MGAFHAKEQHSRNPPPAGQGSNWPPIRLQGKLSSEEAAHAPQCPGGLAEGGERRLAGQRKTHRAPAVVRGRAVTGARARDFWRQPQAAGQLQAGASCAPSARCSTLWAVVPSTSCAPADPTQH